MRIKKRGGKERETELSQHMGTLGDLCIHIKVLKIEIALLVILHNMCGTAATPTNRKYLARFTVSDGEKPK